MENNNKDINKWLTKRNKEKFIEKSLLKINLGINKWKKILKFAVIFQQYKLNKLMKYYTRKRSIDNRKLIKIK